VTLLHGGLFGVIHWPLALMMRILHQFPQHGATTPGETNAQRACCGAVLGPTSSVWDPGAFSSDRGRGASMEADKLSSGGLTELRPRWPASRTPAGDPAGTTWVTRVTN
jgi:hypothetical protein